MKQRAEPEVKGEYSKMLKFIRGKGQQPTAERQKLQKDLFAFRKVRRTYIYKKRERDNSEKRRTFATW